MAVNYHNLKSKGTHLVLNTANPEPIHGLSGCLQPVSVNNDTQIVQFKIGSRHKSLPQLPLRKLTVSYRHIDPGVQPVKLKACRQSRRQGYPLSQRACIGFNARKLSHVRMSLQTASQLFQRMDIGFLVKIAAFHQSGILDNRRMPFTQQETISFLPVRLRRVMPHFIKIQNRNNIRQRTGASQMSCLPHTDHRYNVFPDFPGLYFQFLLFLLIKHCRPLLIPCFQAFPGLLRTLSHRCYTQAPWYPLKTAPARTWTAAP